MTDEVTLCLMSTDDDEIERVIRGRERWGLFEDARGRAAEEYGPDGFSWLYMDWDDLGEIHIFQGFGGYEVAANNGYVYYQISYPVCWRYDAELHDLVNGLARSMVQGGDPEAQTSGPMPLPDIKD